MGMSQREDEQWWDVVLDALVFVGALSALAVIVAAVVRFG
jgi:hypothetical protein